MLNLIPIERTGRASKAAKLRMTAEVELLVEQVCEMALERYETTGFALPWIGYLVEREGEIVGTCSFRSPPRAGVVEIAYYTFPEFEHEGLSAAMAVLLIVIATTTDPTLAVTAQTLPVRSASHMILRQLGFSHVGSTITPEDGKVWEWRRPAFEPAPCGACA